ncbi:hypothetical protein I4F81_009037 [Pyropia yezoensis]|uniref:Uncharacterized protein n=1 Tax=Pyropia yezoensis TaxID=2788 RepID=A0ACC3C8B0_PYRYE|nr:hypothetical protein I4F81_009037 [Neopyropia yezoensis]
MEAAEGTSAGPTPPPAPRPRLRSLVFPPLFGFGAGVMDLLFATHVVAVVMSLDGSALVGIGALAVGAAASIVAAPLVAAVSDQRLGGRAPLAVALNLSAAAAAAGVAGLAGMHSPSADGARYADGQEPAVAPLVAAVGLAAAYRCVTASSPSVPALIETAMARGEGAAFPARRVAYGTLGAVIAPYYASIIFLETQGSGRSLRWTAMAALSAWAVGLGVDAGVPVLAGQLPLFLTRLLWPAFFLVGAGLFVGLALATTARQAITLLTCQALVTSGHAYFSLVGAGSLVPPALRATTFGMRAAAATGGLLVGGLGGGAFATAWDDGYRYTMFLSAGACGVAAAAAWAVGPLPDLARVPGVATSANPLWAHLAARVVGWARRTRQRRRAGGTAAAAAVAAAAVAAESGDGGGAAARAAPCPSRPADYWLEDEAAYWRWQEAAKAATAGAEGEGGGGGARDAAAAALADGLAAAGGVEALTLDVDASPDASGAGGV